MVGIVIVRTAARSPPGPPRSPARWPGPDVRIEAAGGDAGRRPRHRRRPRARRDRRRRAGRRRRSCSATSAARSSPRAPCSTATANGHVRLVDAPLVEGAVAAAVPPRRAWRWTTSRSRGGGLRCQQALRRPSRCRPASTCTPARPRSSCAPRWASGAHRRRPPATREADAKSLLSVLALGAKGGTTLRLRADGDDAPVAVDALAGCVAGLTTSAATVGGLGARSARARAASRPRASSAADRSRASRRRARRRRSARRRRGRRAAAPAPGPTPPRRRPRRRARRARAARTRAAIAREHARVVRRRRRRARSGRCRATACGQVVGADREEVGRGGELARPRRPRRRLDHRAER